MCVEVIVCYIIVVFWDTVYVAYIWCTNKKLFLKKKFIIFINVTDFITKFIVFTEENSRHMQQMSLQYLDSLKNYSYLNL